MSTVHRPYRTPEERRRDDQVVSNNEAVARLGRALFILTQPLMAIAAVLARLVLIRQRAIRPVVYLLAAVAAVVVVLGMGGLNGYLVPWVELARTIQANLAGGTQAVGAAVRSAVEVSWLRWLIGCLPVAAAGGFLIGAIGAAVRARAMPKWRDEKPLQAPKGRQRARVQRAVARRSSREQGDPTIPLSQVRIHLGIDATTRKPYSLTVGEVMKHVYLDGPTGFGKTTTLLRLIDGLISPQVIRDRHVPIVLINMKPDDAVTDALRAIAKAGGRRLRVVTHDGESGGEPYNPLKIGTSHQLAGAIAKAEAESESGGFTEPHHFKAAHRYLNLVTAALDDLVAHNPATWQRDYASIAALMNPNMLASQGRHLSHQVAHRVQAYSAELAADRDLTKSISGLRQRIAGAAESAAGAVLTDRPESLVLQDALLAGDMVVFNLDAAADGEAAQLVGNLAIVDLTRTMARLKAAGWNGSDPAEPDRFALIAVDEFSALGGTLLSDLFERARNQGAGILLSTQQADALDLAGPAFRASVVTNTNVQILHQQTINAETWASYFGTETYLVESRQLFEERSIIEGSQVYASGQGNARDAERFTVHPNELRKLGIGEVVVGVKSRRQPRPALVVVQQWTPRTSTDVGSVVQLDQDDDDQTRLAGADEHAAVAGTDPDHVADTDAQVEDELAGWQWDDDEDETGGVVVPITRLRGLDSP